MKRSMFLLTAFAVVLFLAGTVVYAQGHSGGGQGSGGGAGMHGGPNTTGGGGGAGMHGSTDTTGGGRGAGMHGSPDTTGGGGGKSAGASSKQLTNVINNPDSKLGQKLTSLLPSGMTLQQASSGFKSLGRFVAAVHVSKNLDIPFDQLKAKMVGPPTESLGKAIQQLKPDADSKTEATKATKQAKDDINESGS